VVVALHTRLASDTRAHGATRRGTAREIDFAIVMIQQDHRDREWMSLTVDPTEPTIAPAFASRCAARC